MHRNGEIWRSRGYIPHDIDPERIQFVTIRLYDAVPKQVIRHWQKELNLNDAIDYVENNPVKAGLVSSKELWRWSSAFYRR